MESQAAKNSPQSTGGQQALPQLVPAAPGHHTRAEKLQEVKPLSNTPRTGPSWCLLLVSQTAGNSPPSRAPGLAGLTRSACCAHVPSAQPLPRVEETQAGSLRPAEAELRAPPCPGELGASAAQGSIGEPTAPRAAEAKATNKVSALHAERLPPAPALLRRAAPWPAGEPEPHSLGDGVGGREAARNRGRGCAQP